MGADYDQTVRYEMSLSPDEARSGVKRLLTRQGKKLEVSIPSGSREGTTVRLANALMVTDERPGDILITVKVKESAAGVTEIDESSFEREVISSGLPVVVDFWAPWCGPCRMISPIMEKLSGLYAGRLKFCKINVDENPQAAARYEAMSIPLLVFFKGGTEIDRSVGALPEGALRQKIDSILG